MWSQQIFTLSLRLFLRGSSLLLSKILQAMPVKPRPLWSVRNQFEHPNDSLQWIMLLFSHMKCFLWNIKLILSDSVRCFEIFDHWGDVLICLLMNTSAPSHWLKSVAWPVGPVLKFRDILDWWNGSWVQAFHVILIA